MISKDILLEINQLTTDLIESGLCDDQNFPSFKEESNKISRITINDIENSVYLKNSDYRLVYEEMKRKRMFNIKMLDGALILLQYDFKNGELLRHRLFFFHLYHC